MKDDLEKLELRIALFLRYGVIFSGLLMLVGWLASAQFSPGAFAEFHNYRPVAFLPYVETLWGQRAWGSLISSAGLLVLLLLPITRVLLTAVLFFKQKENIMGGIALFVLIALAFSFSLGAIE